jgi:hypothetical protein
LESLIVENERLFSIFTGLISLKHINIDRWDEMIDLDDIFDPSKILYLEADLMHLKQLRLFTNLRSLEFNNSC